MSAAEWSSAFRKILTPSISGVEQFFEASGTAHQKTQLRIPKHPNPQQLITLLNNVFLAIKDIYH